MKLQCQVEVVNRLHSNLNIRSNNKYLKSTLALGKEPKKEAEYFILHFSSVNKHGTKYKLKSMKQVFVKCLSEGKATIRFEEPPHDLCIKCNQTELKKFMTLLKCCVTGDTKNINLSNISSVGIIAKESVTTKLKIHNRSEFPPKGLPRTLESLHIVGLKLCNFRRDILSLNNLLILDLSNNEIEKIPAEFGRLPSLCELYLANNALGNKEQVDWRWLLSPQISKNLKLLDLSGNKLKALPKAIWKLQNLVTFKINNNHLAKLPATIGRISTLRYLTVAQNQLITLPCSLMQCRLEHFDLSCNRFNNENVETKKSEDHMPWELYINSLVHMSAKIVLKQKFYYSSNIIPWTLVELLDNSNMCVCGKPVLNDSYVVRQFELKDYFREVVFNSDRYSTYGFECYFCSSKCLIK